jgi:biopolymer transport protein ExbD/biopolymer transport protein TolR
VVRPSRGLEAQINVTPLVDVVLVLLIIFMVVTPLAERELAVQLSTEKRTQSAAEIAPTQVLVAVEGSGNLRINSQPVARDAYVNELKKLLADRSPADQVVFVVAGDGANYGALVEAIDWAKQAGATNVGLATDATP